MSFVVGKRALLRFDEVSEILGCSRRHVYDLLEAGHLQAHHREGRPGIRGLRILAVSVEQYLQRGVIPLDEYSR